MPLQWKLIAGQHLRQLATATAIVSARAPYIKPCYKTHQRQPPWRNKIEGYLSTTVAVAVAAAATVFTKIISFFSSHSFYFVFTIKFVQFVFFFFVFFVYFWSVPNQTSSTMCTIHEHLDCKTKDWPDWLFGLQLPGLTLCFFFPTPIYGLLRFIYHLSY